jgi:hypothetical protein
MTRGVQMRPCSAAVTSSLRAVGPLLLLGLLTRPVLGQGGMPGRLPGREVQYNKQPAIRVKDGIERIVPTERRTVALIAATVENRAGLLTFPTPARFLGADSQGVSRLLLRVVRLVDR